MNQTTDQTRVGKLYLLATPADIEAIWKSSYERTDRAPELGDVVYCQKMIHDVYVYQLVDFFDSELREVVHTPTQMPEQIMLHRGVEWLGEATGHLIGWNTKYPASDLKSFQAGESVEAPAMYAEVANYFKWMSQETQAARVRTARPGRLLIWRAPEGAPHPYDCGIVMDNKGGQDPILHIRTKQAGKLVKRKVRASELPEARIGDDIGMLDSEPNAGLFIASHLQPGTIVRLSRTEWGPRPFFGGLMRWRPHALVRKVTRGENKMPNIHLSIMSQDGYLEEFKMAIWAFPAKSILN